MSTPSVQEQSPELGLIGRFRENIHGRARGIMAAAVLTAISIGLVASNEAEAQNETLAAAETDGYPDADMPCVGGPNRGQTTGNGDWCDEGWGYLDGRFNPTLSPRGQNFRRSPDYVFWKQEERGVRLPRVIGEPRYWPEELEDQFSYDNIPDANDIAVQTNVNIGRVGHVHSATDTDGDGEKDSIVVGEYSRMGDGKYTEITYTLSSDGKYYSDYSINPFDTFINTSEAGSNTTTTTTTTTPGTRPTTTTTTTVPNNPNSNQGADGYWLLADNGGVYSFGEADYRGGATNGFVTTDIEATPSSNGYWIVNELGHVDVRGDARNFGGSPALRPGEKVTTLSATETGRGYRLFTSEGRAFCYGDAQHAGDMSQVKLNGPVLNSQSTESDNGYYMVASDGGVFTFGDAKFLGSMGGKHLNAPIESLVPTPSGNGYWLVARDGGIFAFGDAPFRGSMGGQHLNKPVTDMVPYGDGYILIAEDGGVFVFSNKHFHGSLGNVGLGGASIVAAAPHVTRAAA